MFSLRAMCIVAFFLGTLPVVAAADERPNILFLFADDWGKYASIYAEVDGPGGINDVVRTPNFDRVARSGVLFRNAHVNAPSCTPCRSSLLSGQYFWRTRRGAILRGAQWDATIPAYPLLLRDAGYHIGKTYKVWSPGTPADAPYGGQQYAFQKSGGRFNQFSQNATKLVAQGQSVEAAKQALYDEVRGNFRTFLEARPGGEPFCYWFGPTNVHRSWTQGSGKALWNIDPDTLQGKMPPNLPDVPEVREDLADYLGEVAAWDAGVGVILEELEKSGEAKNTLIVISGDHGAPGFPHGKCNLYNFGTGVSLAIAGPGVVGGRVVDDFVNLPDLAPTFLEAAGLPIPEVMTGRSLWPVLKSDRSGLVDPARTYVLTGRERHVENARADYTPYPQRAIRTADHVLIVNFRPDRWPMGDPYRLDGDAPPTPEEVNNNTRVTLPDEDAGPTKAWMVGVRDTPEWQAHFQWIYGKRPKYELYDLRTDPYETKNVADDPAYAGVKADLEKRLLDELTRTGDPRMVDDGKYFETPPLAGPLTDDEQSPKQKPKAKASGDRKSAARKPNVMVFLVDDMGVMDTSVPFLTDEQGRAKRYPLNDYYRTPNMDRLAQRGVRFNNFCAMSVCSPTRISIMTGQNAARHRTTNWINPDQNNAGPHGPPQWNWQGLKEDDVTLARLLEAGGYRTIHVGKGHFGQRSAPGAEPLNLGFDVNVGGSCFGAPGSYYGTENYGHGTRRAHNAVPHLEKYHGTETFLTEALTIEAKARVDAAVKDGQPFFLYLAHYAVHSPFQSDPRFAAHYADSDKPAPAQAFATLIEGMDKSLGDMLDHIESLGVAENTLVFFLGDNGSDAPLGHQHAVACAAPLRGKKGSHYEGGMRVPFIAAWVKPDPQSPWQKRLPIAAGAIQSQQAAVYDLFPTILALAGLEPPAEYKVDGSRLDTLFAGRTDDARQEAFLMHYPHSPHRTDYFTCYREGPWKVIYHYFPTDVSGGSHYQLFNLAADPFEQDDLAPSRPAELRRMMEGLIAALEKADAVYPVEDDGVTPRKPQLP